jgi:hypothetical protein
MRDYGGNCRDDVPGRIDDPHIKRARGVTSLAQQADEGVRRFSRLRFRAFNPLGCTGKIGDEARFAAVMALGKLDELRIMRRNSIRALSSAASPTALRSLQVRKRASSTDDARNAIIIR